ncbi:hypothetical protein CCMA1212_003633 [Trichoderma ghanense]|uniref:Uncharacterized protein n=1 Tax=Trichoderma ghanense TaxID=65468 RepID=A0ABY2H7L4_9HYPO
MLVPELIDNRFRVLLFQDEGADSPEVFLADALPTEERETFEEIDRWRRRQLKHTLQGRWKSYIGQFGEQLDFIKVGEKSRKERVDDMGWHPPDSRYSMERERIRG